MLDVRLPRTIARAFVGSAAVLGALACAGTASAAPGRAAIAGTHPRWAVTAPGKSAPAVTSGTVDLRVYLAGQDPAGLASFAKSVSDPSSSNYGAYLTPAQVRARFGPTAAEAQAVKSWLTSNGLTVTNATNGIGAYVAATGTVDQAGRAFNVSFANYTDPSGRTARAPRQTASAPVSLAGDVLAVSGLDTGTHMMRPADTLPPPGPNYWVAPPTSDYYGQKTATDVPAPGTSQPWAVTGYTPQQIRGAYGVDSSGMTGTGQTVAIVDAYASPTMQSDANQFSRVTGNQPFRSGQYAEYLPKKYTGTSNKVCGASGWYGEETLDVESVHDMAPNANVHYVGAASCFDPDLANADAEIVNQHLASIVSNSWGEPADTESMASVFDQIFQAGASEGIGFYFSSGDSGYEDPAVESPGISDQLQVDFPTSSPWVTSVGGTSLAIGASNNYEWETSWGTLNDPLAASGGSWLYSPPPAYNANTYDGSSGGGVSTAYIQPWYQHGVVPNRLAEAVPEGTTSTPMRVVPDVSALADPATGMLVGQTTLQPDGKTYAFSLSRIGGTSVASPTFAGIQADAQQAAGQDLGFANPAIYARAGTAAFHDVADPSKPVYEVRNNYTNPDTKAGPLLTNLRELGVDGAGAAALPATAGYDDSTGVGSPDRYIQSFGQSAHHRR